MDNKTFIDILNSKYMTFTTKELQDMIDEELGKNEDEMDVELIKLCLDALNGKFDEEPPVQNKSKKRIKISKALLIAAIIIIILSIAIPVGAKYINMNASADTITYNGKYFDIDLHGSDNNKQKELKNLLLENDIDSLTVPSAILNGEWAIDNFYIDENPKVLNLEFNDENNGLSGYLSVLYYKNDNFIEGILKANNNFENIYETEINGIKTLVLNNDNNSCIYYAINGCEYTININCDFDTAKNILTTIKTEEIINEY